MICVQLTTQNNTMLQNRIHVCNDFSAYGMFPTHHLSQDRSPSSCTSVPLPFSGPTNCHARLCMLFGPLWLCLSSLALLNSSLPCPPSHSYPLSSSHYCFSRPSGHGLVKRVAYQSIFHRHREPTPKHLPYEETIIHWRVSWALSDVLAKLGFLFPQP